MMTSPRLHLIVSIAAIAFSAIAAVLIAGAFGGASERILTVFFISLIGVAGIGIYAGNSGILSFGHLAFMGIGAYVSSILTLPAQLKAATLPKLPDWLAATQLDLVPATLVAILLTAAVALLVGWAIGRLEGSAAVIATLGLLIIVHGIIIGWRDVTRGAQSFFGVPRETGVWTAAIGCVLALVVARLYRDSVSGLRLRAGREDPISAGAVGIHIRRERLIAWVISAAVMALAGALLAHFLGAFSAKKFYFVDTFLLLAMLIVGGMSTVTGAITGAVVITVVTELLRRLESGFSLGGFDMPPVLGTAQIGIALIILFAMFRKPNGLTGTKEWEERVFRVPATVSAEPVAPVAQDRTALSAQNLIMQFGGLRAVDDVSLQVAPSEIVGLIGPNGSGKTTCLNMLSGVIAPTSGTIRRGEVELTGLSSPDVAEHGIARTFQNIRLFSDLTVRQNVLAAALSTKGGRDAAARTHAALERLGLTGKAMEDAGTLSYGDQRRVEIARALACQPSILFLDEPAAGMNREETQDLMNRLRDLAGDLGLGILLVDHDLHLINQLCTRIAVLNEGHLIAEGSPDEIRKNPAVIEAYLGRGKEN
ncbi:branched-chain amino acid ABC transporter ATP-binding protein/permease [Paracoccus seriniphilus]|uniref:Amino acid/amide ABC transporter membrane protein 2, HAAT family /amino acid/amide ABC transporter ATP-binding protein 1, HAAT family n=2 Tax=Paracoccus seriniphilus TaxID=184748 RepID=A0A239Q3F3_9RHOB|nr:branched-chain amino acid ABC transporter ATP-binding protein/permease [Paracoccus seriniphilus]WCR15581.1 branched-chain amino acid ABC transporter ATP-binding protein/permease [Paracoccus seriniphilus]SNT76743.1 amino acid/amide ABC transporter membrane protein 2, HAAT family /amino acid/amide ABC transporter ATP-binding protein 1, HAAT family [Paracoccus seriniphilus]